MATVIAEAKKNEMEVIKTIRPSTWGAKLDASGGYNGNCDCTALVRSLQVRVVRVKFATPENPNSPDNRKNGQDAADADDPENGRAVFCARWIIVIAEQQDVIDGRTNPSGRSVHQAEAHVAPGVFDAIKVTRDAAVRGQEHHAAGVRE